MATSGSPKKFTTQQAAKFIGIKGATLDYWRWVKKGPVYVKLGGRVFYLEDDLLAFIQGSRVMPAGKSRRPAA